MRETSLWPSRLHGGISFPGSGAGTRGGHSMHRWLAIVVTATGVLCSDRALAAEPPPLAWFAGTWQCAGKFESNGKPIEARVRFDWNETAGALVKHHDDQPPNAYHAVEVWGGDAAKGLAATIVDGYSGTRLFTSAGWTDESLTWTRTVDAKPVERFVYVRKSEDQLRIDWATSKDGSTYRLGDTLSCERQRTA